MVTRRQWLQRTLALGALAGLPPRLLAAESALDLAEPAAFSFERLRERARRLAHQPFEPTPPTHPDVLERIDYDTHQTIQYRADHALWADAGQRMPVEFFHQGKYFQQPVTMHVVRDGRAQRIVYAADLFDYGDTGLADELPDDLGFAGFRVLNPPGREGDWLAFLGASYFRSAGPLNQYGLSARGIAIDTAQPGADEEFPRFTAFWLEQPAGEDHRLTVYALLDGPSLTGAYRFDCSLGESIHTDVHADLFLRDDIEQLDIAPLNSMYWYSETNHRTASDWRPEIHDSDGLALWTGAGERIWRPLNAPTSRRINTFNDRDPRGASGFSAPRAGLSRQEEGGMQWPGPVATPTQSQNAPGGMI